MLPPNTHWFRAVSKGANFSTLLDHSWGHWTCSLGREALRPRSRETQVLAERELSASAAGGLRVGQDHTLSPAIVRTLDVFLRARVFTEAFKQKGKMSLICKMQERSQFLEKVRENGVQVTLASERSWTCLH